MDQGQTPSTPTRQTSSSSAGSRQAGDSLLGDSISKASQSTPASSSQSQPPAPTSGEPSFNTSSSGDGSIVLRSLSDHTSGSAIESSFEALNLGHTEQASTDSSLEIIVHSSPATTGFLAFSQPLQGQYVVPSTPAPHSQQSNPAGGGGTSKDTRHSRQSSLVAIAENKALAILSPVAQEFAPPARTQTPASSTVMRTFEEIVAFGKDEWGQLTTRAKEALSRLGLKAIPSLHGPLNLPYARCASGIDAFVPSDDPEGEPWGEDEHDEGGQPRQRTLPIPLPGNSRYTQAGRLAMRYSSAPGALESAAKRLSSAPSSPLMTRPPPSSNSKSKKPSPPSQPPLPRQQQSQQAKLNQQRASADSSNIQAANTRTPQIGSAQMELDAQAFARAQAMQAYFIQQAQLAQFLGSQQGGTGFLAPQPQINLPSNTQSPPLSNLGFSRAQSPFLPPFQPFTPPVPNASLPSSQQQQPPNYFDNSNQVDSITLLKLAGQRQLGLNHLQYPIPQLNIPQHPLSNLGTAGSDVGSQESEGLGGRQGELEEEEDGNDYDRSAVQYSTGRNVHSGGTGYDFLRQSSPRERRASSGGGGGGNNNSRRNSSSTRPEQQQHQARSHQGTRSAHESRRRRSAAPTVPYPGHSHSHRKTSTSSVVTVNSTIPGPIPQVRILSDPSSPPTASISASQRRRSMVPTGRPLEDLANSQLLASTSVSVEKQSRTSPAEASTNWRRPSLPDSNNPEALSPQVRIPTPVDPPASSSSSSQPVEPQPSRGRGRGGRGRKRGNRGALKPLGR
ncbi:hypothetical protein JCM3765_002936 [Sporobolomyces pararoseus]